MVQNVFVCYMYSLCRDFCQLIKDKKKEQDKHSELKQNMVNINRSNVSYQIVLLVLRYCISLNFNSDLLNAKLIEQTTYLKHKCKVKAQIHINF